LQTQADEVSDAYSSWFDMEPAVAREDWIRLSGTRHVKD
jgi:ribosomal protein L11 methyltransferase